MLNDRSPRYTTEDVERIKAAFQREFAGLWSETRLILTTEEEASQEVPLSEICRRDAVQTVSEERIAAQVDFLVGAFDDSSVTIRSEAKAAIRFGRIASGKRE